MSAPASFNQRNLPDLVGRWRAEPEVAAHTLLLEHTALAFNERMRLFGKTSAHQFAMLRQFFPKAARQDWREAVAGQRVQIIKPDSRRGGVLEFGTELVAAEDKSLVALLGASPGASTAAAVAVGVLEKCFAGELTESGWLPKLKRIIPTYGIDLTRDAEACLKSRAETAPVLKVENI